MWEDGGSLLRGSEPYARVDISHPNGHYMPTKFRPPPPPPLRNILCAPLHCTPAQGLAGQNAYTAETRGRREGSPRRSPQRPCSRLQRRTQRESIRGHLGPRHQLTTFRHLKRARA